MQKKTKRTVGIKTVTTLHLKSKDIRELLAAAGHEVPKDAYIHVMVPGGNDWSDTDVGIDECDGNLMVRFEVRTKTTEEV